MLGQLSTVRKLLDSGTATVEDCDKVSVCVCVCVRIYLLRNFKAAIYDTNCVSFFDNMPRTPCVCACCVHACVSARLMKFLDFTPMCTCQRTYNMYT